MSNHFWVCRDDMVNKISEIKLRGQLVGSKEKHVVGIHLQSLMWKNCFQDLSQRGPSPNQAWLVPEDSIGSDPGHVPIGFEQVLNENEWKQFEQNFEQPTHPVHWFPESLRRDIGVLASIASFLHRLLHVGPRKFFHVLMDEPFGP